MQRSLTIGRVAGTAIRTKPATLISIKEAIRCLGLVIQRCESAYRICRDQRGFWDGEAIEKMTHLLN